MTHAVRFPAIIASSLGALALTAPPVSAQDEDVNLRQERPGPQSDWRRGSDRDDILPFSTFLEVGIAVLNISDTGAIGGEGGADSAGLLRGGVTFFDRAGLEVDYSRFLGEETAPISSGSVDGTFTVISSNPDALTGLYARWDFPLNRSVTAHVRGGFARLDVETRIDDQSALAQDDDNGYSVGLGARWAFGERGGLRLDYNRFVLNELEGDGGSLVFGYRF